MQKNLLILFISLIGNLFATCSVNGASVSASIGGNYFVYSESNQPDYTALNNFIYVKLKQELPWFGLQFNMDGSLQTFTFDSSQENVLTRYYEATAGLSYPIPWKPSSIDLTFRVNADVRYSSFKVSGSRFGYKDVYYVRAFPSIDYVIDEWNQISAFARYLPAVRKVGNYSIRAREISYGAVWTKYTEKRTYQVKAEGFHAKIKILNIPAEMQMFTFALSGGVSFF